MSDLLTTEVADRMSAPARAEAGRKKRWSSPTSMRAMCGPTSPMKPIVPTKATGMAASRLDHQHGLEPQARDVDAEARGLVLAQPQRGQRPGAGARRAERPGQASRPVTDELRPCRLGEAAHRPEHDRRQRLLRGEILQQRQQRIEGEDKRDAEKHDRLDRHAAHVSEQMDEAALPPSP